MEQLLGIILLVDSLGLIGFRVFLFLSAIFRPLESHIYGLGFRVYFVFGPHIKSLQNTSSWKSSAI